jgi:hypothetical protein
LSFRFVAADAQRTVGRLELDVATQQSGFQFGLDGHNGPERDDFEVVVSQVPETPIVTISTQSRNLLFLFLIEIFYISSIKTKSLVYGIMKNINAKNRWE